MDIAVRIPTPVVEHDGRRPERCDRCGSQGFNLHQRATKALKDPLTLRADVIRFICKRCRKTTRLYPTGVDSARQTVALRTRPASCCYWVGLSYDGIRELPRDIWAARSPKRPSGRTYAAAACWATGIGCAPILAPWPSRPARTAALPGCCCAGGPRRSGLTAAPASRADGQRAAAGGRAGCSSAASRRRPDGSAWRQSPRVYRRSCTAEPSPTPQTTLRRGMSPPLLGCQGLNALSPWSYCGLAYARTRGRCCRMYSRPRWRP